ncbi:hypothetical protein ACFPYI_02415 [Halomarina salina]|uniref:Uncharacterized protein n=1 Tax=Halomarina salina TaxID=1872699 RepID=A0ABD5RI89_9EURY|nr:hypothetical protein [Halomarina salina]
MVDGDVTSESNAESARSIETAENAIAATESYEADGGWVLFDGENPLAWIESAVTVRLDDAA